MDRTSSLFCGAIDLCQRVIWAIESPRIHFFLGENDDLCMYADPGYTIRLGTSSEIANWDRETAGKLVLTDGKLPQRDKLFMLLTGVLVGTERFPDNVIDTIHFLLLTKQTILTRIGSQWPDYADVLSNLNIELVGFRSGSDWIGQIRARWTMGREVRASSTISFSPELVSAERYDLTFQYAVENLAQSVSKLIAGWREGVYRE